MKAFGLFLLTMPLFVLIKPLTLTFCMDFTLVIGNKFHDDTMMGT